MSLTGGYGAKIGLSGALLVAGGVLLIGGLVWLSVRNATAQSGEQELELTVVCASCGYAAAVSFDRYANLINEGQAAHPQIGSPGAPIGVCPKCRKAALYRAEFCPKCGKPVAPEGATSDGRPAGGSCRACGWSGRR